jgi:protein-S-isoprenylcysteine O-methyltransferase Ste14
MSQFTQYPPEAVAQTGEDSQTAQANAIAVPSRYYLAAAALILLTALPTLLVYPQLPSVVPLQGETNAFGPKWSLFLYTPGLMIGILLMFIALPRISVRRFQTNSSRPSYLYVMIVIVTLLSYSQILVLLSGLGWNVNERWGMAGGVCLLIVLLGNMLLKMRRNLKATA